MDTRASLLKNKIQDSITFFTYNAGTLDLKEIKENVNRSFLSEKQIKLYENILDCFIESGI